MAAGDVTASILKVGSYKSAYFPGAATDYIDCGSNISQTINALDEFSISLHIKFRVGADNQGMFGMGNGYATDGYGFVFRYTATNYMSLLINNGSGTVAYVHTTTITDDNLTHNIILTFNRSGNCSIYLDGVQINNGTGDISAKSGGSLIYSPIPNFYIGRYAATATLPFKNGNIRDFRIYDHILSSTERSKINVGENINNGLIAYYPFEDDYNDYSGFANHGSISGNVQLIAMDDEQSESTNLQKTIKSARVNANNKYLLTELGVSGKVAFAGIEEA